MIGTRAETLIEWDKKSIIDRREIWYHEKNKTKREQDKKKEVSDWEKVNLECLHDTLFLLLWTNAAKR